MMTHKTGKLMMGYGVFLVVIGVLGFLSNPEKAKTALISGGTFGTLSVVLGVMITRGVSWSGWAATGLVTMLTAVFVWRSSASWSAYSGGQSEKLVAAILITSMGVASIAMLVALLRGRSKG